MNKILKIDTLYLFVFLLGISSGYASDKLDEQEIRWLGSIQSPHNPEWHTEALTKVKKAYQTLQELDQGSLRNVATFRLVLKYNEQVSMKYYDDTMFVSGGNAKVTSELGSTMNIQTQCIANYCPTIPSKPKDFALRENIVEFFGFKESLTNKQKGEIIDAFSDCLNDDNYFSDFLLTSKSTQKLQGSLSDSLCYRQFDQESDEMAKNLGLINKTSENVESYEHVNDLFGKNFQLNFGDSEQTIRLFIGKISSNEKFDLKFESNEFTYFDKLNESCAKIQFLHKAYNHKSYDKIKDIDNIINQLKELEKTVIPPINDWVAEHLGGFLEITSYYDMCANCNATFTYDFKQKNHIARTILNMFFNTIKKKDNENLIWCLKGWSYDPPKSGLTLNPLKINLIVTSLKEY